MNTLTFYTICLMTTDDDGDPIERTLHAPYLDDVEGVLAPVMNEGDTAIVYQIDAPVPTSPEEAVQWARGEARYSLQILVAEVSRESEYEAPIVAPVEYTGFIYTPSPEIQA